LILSTSFWTYLAVAVFTRINAGPEHAPPSIKRRTWSGKVESPPPNNRRCCGAVLFRVLFVVLVKMLEGN